MSKKCKGCEGFLSAKALLCRYCLSQDPFWKKGQYFDIGIYFPLLLF
jgi:hypothetical protein